MGFSTESTDIVICTHMKKVDVRDNVRHFQSMQRRMKQSEQLRNQRGHVRAQHGRSLAMLAWICMLL